MYRPGDTINERLVLGQLPDAAPVVRVFRNGVRTDTVTISGVATGYLVSFAVPSGWATTDFVQVVAYPLFGGQQYATEVVAGRLGAFQIRDTETAIAVALVCDQVPDATPGITTYLDGVASGATASITSGAVAGEYVVTVNPVSLTTGSNVVAVATAVFGGQSYPVELWDLSLAGTSSGIAPITATYTPGVRATSYRQTDLIYRDSDGSFEFNPAGGPEPINADDFHAEWGVLGSASFVTFSVAAGNLDIDESTGRIVGTWTRAQSLALSLTANIVIDLIQDTVPVGRLRPTVVETLHT